MVARRAARSLVRASNSGGTLAPLGRRWDIEKEAGLARASDSHLQFKRAECFRVGHRAHRLPRRCRAADNGTDRTCDRKPHSRADQLASPRGCRGCGHLVPTLVDRRKRDRRDSVQRKPQVWFVSELVEECPVRLADTNDHVASCKCMDQTMLSRHLLDQLLASNVRVASSPISRHEHHEAREEAAHDQQKEQDESTDHATAFAARVRLRNTSSRSGSRVETSTIPNPAACTAPSTSPALTRSLA